MIILGIVDSRMNFLEVLPTLRDNIELMEKVIKSAFNKVNSIDLPINVYYYQFLSNMTTLTDFSIL